MVCAEVRLARLEIKAEGRKMMEASTMLIAGAVLGFYALGFLLLTGGRALELIMPPWLATLIVGVRLCICTPVAVSIGRERPRKV